MIAAVVALAAAVASVWQSMLIKLKRRLGAFRSLVLPVLMHQEEHRCVLVAVVVMVEGLAPTVVHSSRSSGRSGMSREDAKHLNANKAPKLASFKGSGTEDDDEGYDMGIIGGIDLATRKGPSPENTGGLPPPSLMSSSGWPTYARSTSI